MAILVERSGKETVMSLGDAEGCALSVSRSRKVWDEPFPFERTSSSFFDGPRFHFAEDVFVLVDDGKYHYSHTYPPDRPLVEALAMVGGAAGALERSKALAHCVGYPR